MIGEVLFSSSGRGSKVYGEYRWHLNGSCWGYRRAVDEQGSQRWFMGHCGSVYDMLKSSLDPGIGLNEGVDETGGREREIA